MSENQPKKITPELVKLLSERLTADPEVGYMSLGLGKKTTDFYPRIYVSRVDGKKGVVTSVCVDDISNISGYVKTRRPTVEEVVTFCVVAKEVRPEGDMMRGILEAETKRILENRRVNLEEELGQIAEWNKDLGV